MTRLLQSKGHDVLISPAVEVFGYGGYWWGTAYKSHRRINSWCRKFLFLFITITHSYVRMIPGALEFGTMVRFQTSLNPTFDVIKSNPARQLLRRHAQCAQWNNFGFNLWDLSRSLNEHVVSYWYKDNLLPFFLLCWILMILPGPSSPKWLQRTCCHLSPFIHLKHRFCSWTALTSQASSKQWS